MSDSDNSKGSFQEQKSYYDKHWRIKNLSIDQRCRIGFIVPNIEGIKGKMGRSLRLCDLGCGKGWLSSILSKYGDVLGVDMSIDMAKRLHPNLKFKQANIIKDTIEGQFDIVVSSEVIEHMEPEFQPIYVKKCYDLLEPDGYLVLTTPNKPIIEAHMAASPITKLQPIETWLDKKSLLSLLQPYFEVENLSTVMFYPSFVNKYRLLNIGYSILYEKMGFYRPIDKILNLVNAEGIYLTLTAHKANQ